jgi:uncharacterized membrane protein
MPAEAARETPRRRVLLLAAVLLGAVPVIFGVIRATSTGDDFRYLWLAGAAIAGSMLVLPPRRDAAHVTVWRACGTVAAGALSAAAIAILMGARAGPGIAIVASAFGLCTGTSGVLATLSRRAR